MKKIEIKTGERYGRLTYLRDNGISMSTSKQSKRMVLCKCDCGIETNIAFKDLRSGNTRSCGCGERGIGNTKHGKSDSIVYKSWQSMLERCVTLTNHAFKTHGGNGIKIYKPWFDFAIFLKDMGDRPIGMVLNRIDTKKDFTPENCEWSKRSKYIGSKEDHPAWIKDRSKIKSQDGRRTDANWRIVHKETLIRDEYKCRINNHECEGKLEVHHILNWINHPELRYVLNNLITLCHHHHPIGRKKETLMSPYLKELIQQ